MYIAETVRRQIDARIGFSRAKECLLVLGYLACTSLVINDPAPGLGHGVSSVI
jgi:hypothetical protein